MRNADYAGLPRRDIKILEMFCRFNGGKLKSDSRGALRAGKADETKSFPAAVFFIRFKEVGQPETLKTDIIEFRYPMIYL